MTFWQENYGFVKEVYDFRCSKYLEWMDNIEAIIGKVMANTQYTAKEFKIIKDTFTSLCRDLDKEATKQWLDLMLDKLSSTHASDGGDDNLSGRDKAMKMQEKKKLESMVERHHGLMAPTMEAQSKVSHYSECYAFGDDIHPVMKVLNEQRHLSCKEIHPHNMDMCEEQIEKQEKVLRTIENQAAIYNELMKRGAKLKANPNAPQFLEKEILKLQETWKDAIEKAKIRMQLLQGTFKDWDTYEQQRVSIITPVEQLEEQFKTYRKIYDPKKGADWLERKKKKSAELKKTILTSYEIITKCFATILALAGEEKRDLLQKQIDELDEKRGIVEKAEESINVLTAFNARLTVAVGNMAELRAWMMPACEKLDFIVTTSDLSPEDRVKEIFELQGQVNEKRPLIEPLEKEIHALLDIEVVDGEGEEGAPEGQTNETALRHFEEFSKIRDTVNELHEKVEAEAGSITQDQKYYAEYLCGVKNFKPWMDEAEKVAKAPLGKPLSLDDTKKLLETVKEFRKKCEDNKVKLEEAASAKNKMEKTTKSEDEIGVLTVRWEDVSRISEERVTQIQELCDTWDTLQVITEGLSNTITSIPDSETPDLSSLEGIFKDFRDANEKKVKLLSVVGN